MKRKFGYGDYLEDVQTGKDLFRSIVDKDIQLAKSLHMALGKPSTTDLFHEVAGNKVHLRGT